MSSPGKAKAGNPAKPGPPSGLAKVEAPTAAKVLERYEASQQAAQLVTAEMSPRRFVDRLLAEGLNEDALSFLAYALPRREALWWGLRCVREVTPAQPKQEIGAAVAAADAWITQPSDARRRASLVAAEAATYGTPAGCIALAVFFSEGSMSPPDCPAVPVGEWFCARTVAAAVLLSSLAKGPDQIAGTARRFAEGGIEVANGRAPWDKPA